MLKAYMEHGLFEGAMKLFKEMSEGGNPIESKSDYKDRVLPDTYTFNTMLDACVAEKRWNDFEYVYRRMLHHGYHFNPKRHLRMVLDACRGGKVFKIQFSCGNRYFTQNLIDGSLSSFYGGFRDLNWQLNCKSLYVGGHLLGTNIDIYDTIFYFKRNCIMIYTSEVPLLPLRNSLAVSFQLSLVK